MSELDVAVARGDGVVEEEECPLCLEPLPPFWDTIRLVEYDCCGKRTCKSCIDKEIEYLDRAVAEGTVGRQEEQLARTCPLCRTKMPNSDNVGRMLRDRFEEGDLPLHMYATLGMHLIDGHGVERNVERGIEILMLGAEKGDPNCQFTIGGRYKMGLNGVPESPAEAKRWWLAAAEQGHAMAEYYLAEVAKDEGNDAEWYLRYMTRSAAKGYDQACHSLGLSHYNGKHGLQKSAEEAIRVVMPAAERGHAGCMVLLGAAMCFPNQELPPPMFNPNFTKGLPWIRRAAETGDETCVSKLKAMEEWASKNCFRCNKEAPPAKAHLRCVKCRAAWYCSKDCQVQHWRAVEAGHKQLCIKWKGN